MSAMNLCVKDMGLVYKLFLSRMDMLPQMIVAFQMNDQGSLKKMYGLSYIYAFLHAIPRPLWPDKPLLTAAYLTSQTYPGAFKDGVNIYPSIMVESFMNFSWFGVPLIGLLVAKLTSWYETFLYSGKPYMQAFGLVNLTFPMGLFNEGIHSNNFASIIYCGVLYFLWLKISKIVLGKDYLPLVLLSKERVVLRGK